MYLVAVKECLGSRHCDIRARYQPGSVHYNSTSHGHKHRMAGPTPNPEWTEYLHVGNMVYFCLYLPFTAPSGTRTGNSPRYITIRLVINSNYIYLPYLHRLFEWKPHEFVVNNLHVFILLTATTITIESKH